MFVVDAVTVGVARAIVFDPDEVEDKVHVERPPAFVAEQAPMLLPLPVAVKVGVVPLTGFALASVKVIEIVDVAIPSAGIGPVPEITPLAALPGVNTTLVPALFIGVKMDKSFVSACVDFKVQVERPLALVAEQAP